MAKKKKSKKGGKKKGKKSAGPVGPVVPIPCKLCHAYFVKCKEIDLCPLCENHRRDTEVKIEPLEDPNAPKDEKKKKGSKKKGSKKGGSKKKGGKKKKSKK